MAYVIQYDGQVDMRFNQYKKKSINPKRILLLSMVILIAFTWMITPARVAVLDFILPGDGAVTRRAAEDMLRQIKEGQPFREAFSDFCIEIIDNA